MPLKSGTRIYRKTAYEALKDAVSHSISQPSQTIAEAASVIRERIRHNGDKRIPSRAIGSTLLLKGLETDHCIILDAQGKGMNAKIYMSRFLEVQSQLRFSPLIGTSVTHEEG